MVFNDTGGANTALGFQALEDNTSHVTNVAVGTFAARILTASFNTAVGGFSLRDNTSGARNTAVGAGALEDVYRRQRQHHRWGASRRQLHWHGK